MTANLRDKKECFKCGAKGVGLYNAEYDGDCGHYLIKICHKCKNWIKVTAKAQKEQQRKEQNGE